MMPRIRGMLPFEQRDTQRAFGGIRATDDKMSCNLCSGAIMGMRDEERLAHGHCGGRLDVRTRYRGYGDRTQVTRGMVA
jgi:hypothetical protein